VRSFVDERPRSRQRHPAGPAGDHRDLAFELSHDHSVPFASRRC